MIFVLSLFAAWGQTPSPTSDPPSPAPAAPSSSWADHVRFYGYAEAYLGLDSTLTDDHRRPPFLYSYARTGGVTLNLAMLGAEVERDRFRGAVAVMGGTFTEDNQGFEEPGLQNIYEARVGVRLAGRTWVDAGVFPSHLGAESAIGIDNPTLTRSLTAENSPYYLAGVKLGTAVGDNLEFGLVAANGWQSIRQTTPVSVGSGSWVTWTPSPELTLNWSTWVGLEQPRGEVRLFNDVYGVVSLGRLDLIGWADVGTQAEQVWAGGNLQARGWVIPSVGVSARVEAFTDPDGVVVTVGDRGATIAGGSVGLDLRLPSTADTTGPVAMWRTEYRLFGADRDLTPSNRSHHAVTTSLAFGF